MVGTTCDGEKEENHLKSKVKILESHSQIWSKGKQLSQGCNITLQIKW